MERENIKTPDDLLVRMQVVHFGKILFNLQFIALAVMLVSVVSIIFVPFYYLMLLMVSLITLFTIYVMYPEFASWWTAGETITQNAVWLSQSWKYTVPILAALAVASIVCLCFDKNNKHIARIVISAMLLVVAVVVLIIKLIADTGAVTV